MRRYNGGVQWCSVSCLCLFCMCSMYTYLYLQYSCMCCQFTGRYLAESRRVSTMLAEWWSPWQRHAGSSLWSSGTRCWVGTSRTATVDKDNVSIFISFIYLFIFVACAQGGSHPSAFFFFFLVAFSKMCQKDSDVARPVQPGGKLLGQKARNKQNKLMGSLSI